jgi:hypothetical protein
MLTSANWRLGSNMKNLWKRWLFLLLFSIIWVTSLLMIGQWAFADEKKDAAEPSKRGHAQMWEQNCGRCHNLRSPSSYSDKSWDIVEVHMRIRGTLTAEETKAIFDFLRAGN